MKIAKIVFFFAFFALKAFSQTLSDPITAPVRVGLRVGALSRGASFLNVSLADGNAQLGSSNQITASGPQSTQFIANLTPGRNYNITGSALSFLNYETIILAPPQGYRLFINDVEQSGIYYTTATSFTKKVRIEINGPTPAGVASDLRPGRLIWTVGLGQLKNGSPAGSLQIRQKDPTGFTASDFSISSLYWASASSEVLQYNAKNSLSFQIMSTDCMIQVDALPNFADGASGFIVSVYDRAQVSSVLDSASGLWIVNNGAIPQYKYKYQRVGLFGATGGFLPNSMQPYLALSKTCAVNSQGSTTERTLTKFMYVLANQPAGTLTWRVTGWGNFLPIGSGGTFSNEAQGATTWTYSNSGLNEEIKVLESDNSVAMDTLNEYAQWSWGVELVRKTEGYGGTNPRTTHYSYFDTPTTLGQHTQLRYIIGPEGNWELYEYYNDDARLGMLSKLYKPYKNTGASPTAADKANGDVTSFDYSTDSTGNRSTRPSSKIRTIGGVTVGKELRTYVDSTVLDTVYSNGVFYTVPHAIVTATIKTYTGSTQFLTSTEEYYREDAGMALLPNGFYESDRGFLPLLQRSLIAPTGLRKTTSYVKGYYMRYPGDDPWTFTDDASGPCVKVQKETKAGNQYVEGGSSKEEEFRDINGRAAVSKKFVYIGGLWQLASGIRKVGTPFRTDSVQACSSQTTNTWSTLVNVWDGGRITQQTDDEGKVHKYTYYDNEWIRTDVLASSSMPYGQPSNDITQKFKYNAAGAVVERRTMSTSSEGPSDIVNSSTYDTADRVVASTENGPNGLLSTSTQYGFGGNPKSTQTTFPNLSTKVVSMYLDGRASTISGTAVYGANGSDTYDYGVEASTGNQYIKISHPTGGYDYQINDWIGRSVRKTWDSYSGSRVAQVFLYSNTTVGDTGPLIESQFVQAGVNDTASARVLPLTAPSLYKYDGLGRIVQSCLDVNENESIDTAGLDRIVEYRYAAESSPSSFVANNAGYSYVGGNTTSVVSSRVDYYTYLNSGGMVKRIKSTFSPFAPLALRAGNGSIYIVSESRDRGPLFETNGSEANSSEYIYDSVNQSGAFHAIQKFGPGGLSHSSASANGFPTSESSSSGLASSITYDNLGRVFQKIERDGVLDEYAYYNGTRYQQALRNAILKPSVIGSEWKSFVYDNSGHLSRVDVNNTGVIESTRYDYDLRGNLLHQWGNGCSPVQFDYDDYNRLIGSNQYRDTGGSIGWNSTAWPGSSSTPDKTIWSYDQKSNLLTGKTYPTAATSGSTSQQAVTVALTYDAMGRLDTRTWGSTLQTRYTYYQGNDANGARGELLSVTYPNSTTVRQNVYTPPVTYKYNQLGMPVEVAMVDRVVDSSGNFTWPTRLTKYQYRPEDFQLQSETQDSSFLSGATITPSYDVNIGRQAGYTLRNSATTYAIQTVSWGFDSSSRVNSVTSSNSGSAVQAPGLPTPPTRIFNYGYHPGSYLLDSVSNDAGWKRSNSWQGWRNIPDAVVTTVGSETSTVGRFEFNYDWLERPVDETTKGALPGFMESANSNGFRKHYLYTGRGEVDTSRSGVLDPTGSETSISLAPGPISVITGQTPTIGSANSVERDWNYDASGNRTFDNDFRNSRVVTTTANALNQTITQSVAGGQTEAFSYDADGNMVSDGTWSYFWDAENRLARMEEKSGSLRIISFLYDHLNRRIGKQVGTGNNRKLGWNAVSSRKFVWNGTDLIAEYDDPNSSSMVAVYTWGIDNANGFAGGVGGLLMATRGLTNYLPVYDSNGNIRGYSDDTGALVAGFDFTAFGETRVSALSSGDLYFPFQFASKYVDFETGLIQYNNRYYSPRLGKFINRDLVGEAGGLNLYGYCGNNPISRFDVLGNNWFTHLLREIARPFEQLKNALQRLLGWVDRRFDDVNNWSKNHLNTNIQGSGNTSVGVDGTVYINGNKAVATDDQFDITKTGFSIYNTNSPNRARSPDWNSGGSGRYADLGWVFMPEVRTSAQVEEPWRLNYVLNLFSFGGWGTAVETYQNTGSYYTAANVGFNPGYAIVSGFHDAYTGKDFGNGGGVSYLSGGGRVFAGFRGVGGVVGAATLGVPIAKFGSSIIRSSAAESIGVGRFTQVSESMSDRAFSYQSRITGLPSGTGYVANGVKFDGFANGILLDAKGFGYARFVRDGRFDSWWRGADSFVEQAQRQIQAARGTPIQWHFAEEVAANATRNLFRTRGITGVQVIYSP